MATLDMTTENFSNTDAAPPEDDNTPTCSEPTGASLSDALLDRLLHDLDVANDNHPAGRGPGRHPAISSGFGDDQHQSEPPTDGEPPGR